MVVGWSMKPLWDGHDGHPPMFSWQVQQDLDDGAWASLDVGHFCQADQHHSVWPGHPSEGKDPKMMGRVGRIIPKCHTHSLSCFLVCHFVVSKKQFPPIEVSVFKLSMLKLDSWWIYLQLNRWSHLSVQGPTNSTKLGMGHAIWFDCEDLDGRPW